MGYIEIAAVRAAGIDETELPDIRCQLLIDYYSDFFDRATGQWFESRPLDLLLDGDGTNLMLFEVPIISMTEIYINENPIALDSQYYAVYNRPYPDDRRNPKVLLKSGYLFLEGVQSQRFVGNFGFVEQGGSCPLAVQNAVLLLVIENRIVPGDEDAGAAGASYRVIKEVTDGHSITYGALPMVGGDSTGIPEVDRAIRNYKRARKMRMSSPCP